MGREAIYRRRRIVNFVNLGISMLAVLFGVILLAIGAIRGNVTAPREPQVARVLCRVALEC